MIVPTQSYRQIIQIELNEISEPVFTDLMARGKMPNLAKIHSEWAYLHTTSETVYEHIEPWIQWVTAHTGKGFDEHGIFRLSDADMLTHMQIWEALSTHGIESAIVGSMNTVRRNTEGGLFFPDPWAKRNEAYPDALKPLWALISSRVQSHATSKLSASDAWAGLQAMLKYKVSPELYLKLTKQLVGQKLNPKVKWKLAAYFDQMLAEIFRTIYRSTDYGYYTLFLNAVAHYQHHYWRNFDRTGFDPTINYNDIEATHDPVTFGYEMYDRILGDIMSMAKPDTLIVIASGLSQVPYVDKEAQGGMNYYRLNNHEAFAREIGLTEAAYRIYPLMSRDWQVAYSDQKSRRVALDLLGGLQVDDMPLFTIKENTEGYIFVETNYSRGTYPDLQITGPQLSSPIPFESVFTNIAVKSGHHSGIGSLWLSDRALRSSLIGQRVPLGELYYLTLRTLTADSAVPS